MAAFVVGIYARFSSSLQNAKSTDDQVRDCKRMASERWPGCEFALYVDAKLSGSFSGNRPAYQRLLVDIKATRPPRLHAVVAEDMDRVARDQEDTAHIHKACKFAGIDYVTISDGKVTELHVGLKGAMNAIFLDALAAKTRRGCRGDVERGKLRGAATFGYRRTADGGRTIDKTEASVVNRILSEYAAGVSSLMIARRLNAEDVPGQSGRKWTASGINGHPLYGTGIINNELYVGRYVWNRLRYVKNPDTGAKVPRQNPPEEWAVVEHPELRIISDKLWEAVRDRQRRCAEALGATRAFRLAKRARHALSGLIKCALCGNSYISSGRRLVCNGKRSGGACRAKQTTREAIERRVRIALEERLFRPELQQAFEGFFKTFVAEENERRARTDPKNLERELANVKAGADRLLDFVMNGVGDSNSVKEKLRVLDTRRKELEEALMAKPVALPRLHPDMAKVFASKVRKLWKALDAGGLAAAEASEGVRGLIDEIRLEPSKDAEDGIAITIVGNVGHILILAGAPDAAGHVQALACGCQRLCVIAA